MGATPGEHRIDGPPHTPKPPDAKRELAGIALAGVAAVAFGTLAIFAKFAYRAGSEVLPLLAVRFIGAALLVAVFHLLTRRTLKVPREVMWKLLLLGGIGYGLEAALFFAALERAPAGVIALIFYSYPLWTVLMGFATKLEPFKWKLVAALVVGSIGVAIVFSPENRGLVGPLMSLGAAVTVAIYFISMQVVLRDVDASSAAFWTSAGAAATTAAAALLVGDALPAAAIVPALALAAVSGIAFISLYGAIVRIGSSRTSVAAMVEPIATLGLAVLLLGEVLTTRLLIGAALIVSALPLLALAGKKEVPAADTL